VIAHVTFDLEGADSEDYANVKDGFREMALLNYLKPAQGGYVELPYNTFTGEYVNIANLPAFSTFITTAVKTVFASCEVTGRAFVLCAGAGYDAASGYLWRSIKF
jgi:hypothetical protein